MKVVCQPLVEERMLYCYTFQNVTLIFDLKYTKSLMFSVRQFKRHIYIINFQTLILKLCFPFSTSKPSSDLLDLQPDFSSGGAAAAAAPAPPPPSGGATAWGGE